MYMTKRDGLSRLPFFVLPLAMQMQLRRPRNLKPTAHVMLRAAHIRRNQEPLVLGEGLRLPVRIEGIRAVHEPIRYRAAAGKE